MKKHSKTGVDARYQGTLIGKPAELRPVKIEGGAEESIEEWCRKTRERAAKATVTLRENVDMADASDVLEPSETSQDMAMEL
jgi:transcription initiation factor TFIID subunit 3